jgi:hypothetical protein
VYERERTINLLRLTFWRFTSSAGSLVPELNLNHYIFREAIDRWFAEVNFQMENSIPGSGTNF